TGDQVALLIDPFSPEPVARYLAALLDELGYRVRSVRLQDPHYAPALYDSDDRFQAGSSGWGVDYTATGSFFEGAPKCGSDLNPYSAAFCDPGLDAIIRRAQAVQTSDRQRASALWASADRRVVDLSPFVALINPISLDFVSARVGNYQNNPQWGILLDQLWVR
ncbi:MAG: hypothetical protein ACR2L0_05700, partial [Gaiellaceae bacterium]